MTILANLDKLPVVRCCLLHHLAYFLFFIIRGNRPGKRGNNVDARHIVSAANADVFISDDIELVEMLKSAADYWPFDFMTTTQFCQKFRNG